jgi:predicted house-cleaning noncanonical NTP pyrophosphatase (MazG superfamily)
MQEETKSTLIFAGIWASVVVVVFLLIGLAAYIYPKYNVYSSSLSGEAVLKKAQYAEYSARIKAKAKEEAAKYLAEAEVERAQGIAKSIKIVGNALNDNPGYLDYRWLQNLKETHNQVIYVPERQNNPLPLFINAGPKTKK